MTGYGKAECLLPDKKLTIEIKSLNSKQLDSNMRLPSLYKEKELDMRKLIAAQLERGKVECSFYYELSENAMTGVINEKAVASYFEQIKRVAGQLGVEASQELLATVMRLPDTLKTEKAELGKEEWEEVKLALEEALSALNEYRSAEGLAMDKDLRLRVEAISSHLAETEKFEKERVSLVRQRIEKNLEELIQKDAIDQNRLEQELIYYLEKLDTSEEKVRLENHCKYFLDTMEEEGPNGKKLGFISQEMGREINTLGSKANHAEIQKHVVDMKDELEKIKEQVLNVL